MNSDRSNQYIDERSASHQSSVTSPATGECNQFFVCFFLGSLLGSLQKQYSNPHPLFSWNYKWPTINSETYDINGIFQTIFHNISRISGQCTNPDHSTDPGELTFHTLHMLNWSSRKDPTFNQCGHTVRYSSWMDCIVCISLLLLLRQVVLKIWLWCGHTKTASKYLSSRSEWITSHDYEQQGTHVLQSRNRSTARIDQEATQVNDRVVGGWNFLFSTQISSYISRVWHLEWTSKFLTPAECCVHKRG